MTVKALLHSLSSFKVTIENEDERPEFSDFGSDVEETLEVENWDDWQGNAEEEEDEQSKQPYVTML